MTIFLNLCLWLKRVGRPAESSTARGFLSGEELGGYYRPFQAVPPKPERKPWSLRNAERKPWSLCNEDNMKYCTDYRKPTTWYACQRSFTLRVARRLHNIFYNQGHDDEFNLKVIGDVISWVLEFGGRNSEYSNLRSAAEIFFDACCAL